MSSEKNFTLNPITLHYILSRMKVVYVYDHVVEVCNNHFYENALAAFAKRYSYLGELTVCVCQKACDHPTMQEVELKPDQFVFIQKENRLSTLFTIRKKNKDILRQIISESDLVITHLPTSVGFLAMSLARKLHKHTLITVVGCPWDALTNSSLFRQLCAPYFFLAQHHWVYRADFVIYVTQHFLQKRYPTWGIKLGCSDVVLPPFNDEILQRRLKHIDEREQNTPFKLITCGGLDVPYKGQHFVIHALAILNKQGYHFHYYLLGLGTGDRLRKLATQLGVQEYVHILGNKPHTEVFKIFDQMDLYVHPSLTEGLPRTVIEAMSRALPCIGTPVGGTTELITPRDQIVPKSINSIIKQLKVISTEHLHRMAIENFNRAKEYEFTKLETKRRTLFDQIKVLKS